MLLLHGERENAGLNVTCASRVFLMESVVHHGFEIQAIARIDRMGQKKPTEGAEPRECHLFRSVLIHRPLVYCYYAEGGASVSWLRCSLTNALPADTLEKNILDLAAKKGLSLYTKSNSAGSVDVAFAGEEALDQTIEAPGKSKKAKALQKGDFVMK